MSSTSVLSGSLSSFSSSSVTSERGSASVNDVIVSVAAEHSLGEKLLTLGSPERLEFVGQGDDWDLTIPLRLEGPPLTFWSDFSSLPGVIRTVRLWLLVALSVVFCATTLMYSICLQYWAILHGLLFLVSLCFVYHYRFTRFVKVLVSKLVLHNTHRNVLDWRGVAERSQPLRGLRDEDNDLLYIKRRLYIYTLKGLDVEDDVVWDTDVVDSTTYACSRAVLLHCMKLSAPDDSVQVLDHFKTRAKACALTHASIAEREDTGLIARDIMLWFTRRDKCPLLQTGSRVGSPGSLSMQDFHKREAQGLLGIISMVTDQHL